MRMLVLLLLLIMASTPKVVNVLSFDSERSAHEPAGAAVFFSFSVALVPTGDAVFEFAAYVRLQ